MAGPRVKRLIRALIGLVGLVFCAVMAWRGGLMTWQAFEYGERVSSSLGTPLVLPYAMLPIGFGALAIQFLIDVINAWRKPIVSSHEHHEAV
jgi:TRAP-type C4-dicarboxylate transport system permease small subunit